MAFTIDGRVDELAESGYLVLEDVLTETDIRPVTDGFAEILDGIADDLYAAGEVSDRCEGLPFSDRLTALTRDAGRELVHNFDITLPLTGVREDTPLNVLPAMFALLTNERLLDVAESLIGGEVLVSPVGHVRLKVPAGTLPPGKSGPKTGASPWHQDNGVVLEEADDSDVLTVWVAITDATERNGCMQVVPTDRSAPLLEHCPSRLVGAHIPDEVISRHQKVTLPMRAGSVLVMHPRTLHGSLENTTSNEVRISMDLRYQPVGQPTGRPVFPSFVARSRSNPSMELHDSDEWARIWHEARSALARKQLPPFNRWDPNSAMSA